MPNELFANYKLKKQVAYEYLNISKDYTPHVTFIILP